MSGSIENVAEKFMKIYDFEATEEVIKAIIETLVEENPSVNVDSIAGAVKLEKIRRKNAAENEKNVKKALSPIFDYIERLVKAAISDMIHEHGNFQIPIGNFDEDEDEEDSEYEDIYDGGVFSIKIQNRYELACQESVKDDRSDQGWFTLEPVGSLRERFKAHGLEISRIEVEFNGVPGDDSVVITSIKEIYDCMGEISMSWNDTVKADDLVKLAADLDANPNKYFLINALKHSER